MACISSRARGRRPIHLVDILTVDAVTGGDADRPMMMSTFRTPYRQKIRTAAAVFAIFVLNVSVQSVFFRHTLSEGTVTSLLPSYTDSIDYMRRAEGLARGEGFSEMFCDGLRMPGYPAFLSLFARVFARPEPAVRVAQILLSLIHI